VERLPRPAIQETSTADLVLVIGSDLVRVHGSASGIVTGVELDSRQVRPGDLFAALPGHVLHGAVFAEQAVDRGAAAILTDSAGLGLLPADLLRRVPVLEVMSPRGCLAELSSTVYRRPAEAMTVLGITGTNGKTTVSYLLEAGLRAAGRTTGVIGTIGIRIGDTHLTSTRTTPEAPHFHAIIGVMREVGVDSVAVEVSSHALEEGRVDGVRFAIAGFTNLSQDHLDYHGTMDAYFAAKAALFTPSRCELAVIGVDDVWGERLSKQATVPVVTWSARAEPWQTQGADRRADWTLSNRDGGWTVDGPNGERTPLDMPLPGAFNRANTLCAFVMLRQLGIAGSVAAAGISQVHVPGRMEWIRRGGPVTAIVDYAHSPDAIEAAIVSVRPDMTGRVIAVIGAGGDRDRAKRPIMGERAARYADVVIVTDDNPRSEDPAAIRAAVMQGALDAGSQAALEEVADRRLAIRRAVTLAQPGDIVLVLGKVHEQGQEIAGTMLPFDDRDEVRQALGTSDGDE
jgi:UDP-N-acetylmuramoyl-L-alanyl-D-glutamate--2,6-diaminopimelate ligase